MSKRSGVILLVLFAVLFLVVNRGAYRGYFHDDEFDTLGWARYGDSTDYLKGALTPRFQENNFRPVGHFYFHAAEHFFGLDFPKYLVKAGWSRNDFQKFLQISCQPLRPAPQIIRNGRTDSRRPKQFG